MQGVRRNNLLSLLALLASGALAAAATAWFLSGRVPSVTQSTAASLSLFLTLYALSLTAVKLGTDGFILSKSAAEGGAHSLGLRRFLQWWAWPVIVLSACAIAWKFGWQVWVPSMVAMHFDLRSVTMAAALTGAGDSTAQSIGTLLNFPVFFLGLYVASLIAPPDIATIATLFAGSSMLRYAYLSRRSRFPDGPDDIAPSVLAMLGLQQCLNYLLFRADQILLSLARNLPVLDTGSPSDLADYLVHSKAYEAACTVTMLACMVAQPRATPSTVPLRSDPRPRLLGWLEAALLLASVCALALGWFERSDSILLPFVTAAALSLPVNRRTLQALRNDDFKRLIMALGVSLSVGLLGAALLSRPIELSRLAYLVPVQMLAFLCIARAR